MDKHLTESRLHQALALADLGSADFEQLDKLQATLDEMPAAIWTPLDHFLEQELTRFFEHPDRRALFLDVMKGYFRSLLTADMAFEATCNRLQMWLEMQHTGMVPEWPALVHERYLRLVAAALNQSDARAADGSLDLVRKAVFLHLGLATAALLHGEQEHYRQQLFFDAATKLPGSDLFIETVDRQLGATEEGEAGLVAVVLLETVSSHRLLGYPGYPTLDQFMVELSARLKPVLRPHDYLARLGREEFGIMLPKLRSDGQAMLAANKLIASLQLPISLQSIEILVQPSLGIALYPEHGSDGPTLMRMAETARVAARSSSESYVIYQPDLDQNQRLQRSMETELRLALRENELMLYYQPQAACDTGIVHGVEALLRWRNPRGEFVPPNVIVSVAEQCGLMTELTRWILNTALRQCADIRSQGMDITFSVNLAAQDLLSSEFVEVVDQSLRTWGVPANRLLLEITEGSMISEVDAVRSVLMRLKEVGVEISVDDFGTGYSSLAYLRRLPLDELKIDQVFVRQMLRDSQDERIVRTIIDLAHNLQLRVVAEGVEDEATWLALKDLQCDLVQGYYLSRPQPMDKFMAWWLERQSTPQSASA
jgi:diguanylate cyclase (GGDEF)-like protein